MEWRINIRGTAKMRAAVEAVRDEQKDGADTAQVIRRLLVEALEARGKL